MACVACEQVPKRINNLFRDEELKEKFENLTGITIFQNLFICDNCTLILLQSHSFKEKCIDVYERNWLKNENCKPNMVKTEAFNDYQENPIEIENFSKDESEMHEEHLEEEEHIETIIFDPLQIDQTPKKRVRLRYSVNDKLKAINLAEQSSNRQAAKILTIDESCIRKWRQQKDQIMNAQEASKEEIIKTTIDDASTESQEIHEKMEYDDAEIECEIRTEVIDETVPVREVRTRKSYSSGEKLQVIAFAEVTGNRQAAKVYKIDESCIRKWRNQKNMIIEINQERGTRRKPNLRFPEVDSRLKAFVLHKMNEGVFLKPCEIKQESIKIAEELSIPNFKGTSSYIFKFMERYHFPSTRSKKTIPKPIKCKIKEPGTTVHIL